MSSSAQQIFLRSASGEVMGPFDPAGLQQLSSQGKVPSNVELSVNGSPFAPASHFPELKALLPAAVMTGGVPMAGPGARARAADAGYRGNFDDTAVKVMTRAEAQAAASAATATAPQAAAPLSVLEGFTSVPPSGDIGKLSTVQLYFLAAACDSTGRLNVLLGDRTIELWFKKGNPEAVSSSHPDDAVARFLLSQDLVSSDALKKADAEKDRFGGELVGALFALGLLNPGTGFAALSQHAGLLLQKALLAQQGKWTFTHVELPSQRAMPLGNRWAVLVEAIRRLPLPELRKRLEPVLDLPVMKSGGRVPVTELRLSPKETRALGYVDGVRSLHHLLHDFPQEAEHLVRIVFLGREAEFVAFAGVKLPPPAATPAPQAQAQAPAAPAPQTVAPAPPAPGPAPASPPPAAAGPAPTAAQAPAAAAESRPPPPAPHAAPPSATQTPTTPLTRPGTLPKMAPPVLNAAPPKPAAPPPAPTPPPTPAEAQAQIAELEKIAAGIREKNLFEVLGLTEKTDSGAVKVAYFKLAKLYHPDTVTAGSPAQIGELKAAIFARVGEAYRTLGDDASRAQYAENLRLGGTGENEVDIAQLLLAEETFQKATLLVKARKYQNALPLLEEAIAINKEEGEFYAWRGFARFMAAVDRKTAQADAEKDLKLALSKNPRCAPAHFFQGQVYKALGDNRRALDCFKKTVELQPDHIDAQREIRLLAKK